MPAISERSKTRATVLPKGGRTIPRKSPRGIQVEGTGTAVVKGRETEEKKTYY